MYEDAAGTRYGEVNELEVFFNEKPLRWVDPTGKGVEFDILSWWKANQVTYPVLSKLARDIFGVQVSTIALEFAFSAGGRVISQHRSSLDPEVVEALICIKDWNIASKRGIINSLYSFQNLFGTIIHHFKIFLGLTNIPSILEDLLEPEEECSTSATTITDEVYYIFFWTLYKCIFIPLLLYMPSCNFSFLGAR